MMGHIDLAAISRLFFVSTTQVVIAANAFPEGAARKTSTVLPRTACMLLLVYAPNADDVENPLRYVPVKVLDQEARELRFRRNDDHGFDYPYALAMLGGRSFGHDVIVRARSIATVAGWLGMVERTGLRLNIASVADTIIDTAEKVRALASGSESLPSIERTIATIEADFDAGALIRSRSEDAKKASKSAALERGRTRDFPGPFSQYERALVEPFLATRYPEMQLMWRQAQNYHPPTYRLSGTWPRKTGHPFRNAEALREIRDIASGQELLPTTEPF